MADNSERSEDAMLRQVTEIVTAYLSKNVLPPEEIPALIRSVHATLGCIAGLETPVRETREPAVPIKKSVKGDYIVCLEDGKKLIIHFEGKDKALVANKTNASIITEITGSDDTDDWIGKRIQLCTRKVEMSGKLVPAIRLGLAGDAHLDDAPLGKFDGIAEEIDEDLRYSQ